MPKLGIIEDTLFVPMLGRIYASEHCPQILYDQKALELKKKLPPGLLAQGAQSQYTLLASAVRSAKMDRYIRSFLQRRPDGVIVQLGCGLETTYFRCDNARAYWYDVDLPHVIAYRRELLSEPERETYFAGDAFAEDWIRRIRTDRPDAPILVTAGGLFHYFEEVNVLAPSHSMPQSGETTFLTAALICCSLMPFRNPTPAETPAAEAMEHRQNAATRPIFILM